MKLRYRLICLGAVLAALRVTVLAQNAAAAVRYDDFKVVRVQLDSGDQVAQIHAIGGRLMSENEMLGDVDYLLAPEDMPLLQGLGLRFKILNDNIQRDIDAEHARLASQGAVDGGAWFLDYKNLDQVNTKLNQLVASRPDLASVFDIGTSFEGRHIYGIHITGPGTNKPGIEFDGCHHAREWISVMVPMWIADQLVSNYDTDPTIHTLVDQLEWFIIPVVNTDGYTYTWTTDRLWRKNRRPPPVGSSCYGVDNNRNYGVGWGGNGASSFPCDETYAGTGPFSEPETQRVRDFFLAHPNIVASQSYHSYSELIMSPYGWTSALPTDAQIFATLDAGMYSRVLAVHGVPYGFGPIFTTIYPAAGNTVDWAYDVAHTFAFTTELRDTGLYGFVLPPNQIIPTCEENFAAVLYLADWSTKPVMIAFPNGLPTRLDPNTPTSVSVQITAIHATIDPNSPLLYSRLGTSGDFAPTALTPLGNNLDSATLPATPCSQTLYYYFSAATTTGSVGLSPADAPGTTYDVPAWPLHTVASWNMDTNPGWTTTGQWAWGHPTGGGGQHGSHDPTSGHTGQNVYGYNLNGDYANNMPEFPLTTTVIDCTGTTGTHVSFWRWLGVEQPAYDHAYIRISTNGTTWTTLWQNTAEVADGQWVPQDLDISAYADNQPTVRIRWVMGTTDGGFVYCGWNIDDVVIWSQDVCPPLAGDMNCDGVVNFADINAFVLALTGQAPYEAAFPNCRWLNADTNNDGIVDFADINPFVALLSGP